VCFHQYEDQANQSRAYSLGSFWISLKLTFTVISQDLITSAETEMKKEARLT